MDGLAGPEAMDGRPDKDKNGERKVFTYNESFPDVLIQLLSSLDQFKNI